MSEITGEIRVSRIYRFPGPGKLKAAVDLVLCGGFIVKGIKVVESSGKLFVNMPAIKGKDGKWQKLAYPVSAEIMNEIRRIVIAAYRC